MATVLVKNLPNVTAVDDNDLLIVNVGGAGDYTTSNVEVGDLRTALNSTTQDFGNDVTVDGNVTITTTASAAGKGFVGNLVGNVTGEADTVASIAKFTTNDLAEGSLNLYFTNERFLELAADYAPLDSPELTGNAFLNGSPIATTTYVITYTAQYAPLAAPALTGAATLNGSGIATAADLAPLGETFTGHSERLDALEADTTAADAAAAAAANATAITDLGQATSDVQTAHQTQTTAAFEAIRDEAVAALAAFQADGATTENKLNACQTFFDNIAVINVQPA